MDENVWVWSEIQYLSCRIVIVNIVVAVHESEAIGTLDVSSGDVSGKAALELVDVVDSYAGLIDSATDNEGAEAGRYEKQTYENHYDNMHAQAQH